MQAVYADSTGGAAATHFVTKPSLVRHDFVIVKARPVNPAGKIA